MNDIIAIFIFFFAVIDPVGSVPVFIAVTSKFDEKTRRKIALQAALASAGILLFFAIAGEFILSTLEIPLAAFQIAGGIVLFLFALSMIFGESKPEQEIKLAASGAETAIFPLAVPSIAGPGSMLAAVLLTESHKFNVIQQIQTTAIMLLVVGITFVFMLLASYIHRFIGNSGASIISRVMGLILSSIAITHVLEGIKGYFVF